MDKKKRQEQLLQIIVQEYIKTARPVSSKILVDKYGFDFSSATIRNDMMVLEEDGLINQPHISAGRVPTEKGYQYYIQQFLHPTPLKNRQKEILEKAVRQKENNPHERMRKVMRTVSQITDEAVVTVTDDGEIFFTGISHIFNQPEFFEAQEMIIEMSEILDRVEEIMPKIIPQRYSEEVRILLGKENPLLPECAMILSPFHKENQEDDGNIWGIFGPMRMDYETNIAVIEYVDKLMRSSKKFYGPRF